MSLTRGLLREVKIAARRWLSTPLQTCVAVLSMSLAIGSTLGLLALVDAIRWRTLPVPAPHRLTKIATVRGDRTFPTSLWNTLHAEQNIFAGVAAMASTRLTVRADNQTQFVRAAYVSGNFFQTIGVPLAIGRGITEADDAATGRPFCVVGYDLWRSLFGGHADVIGRTITVGGAEVSVVGVVDEAFFGLEVGQRTSLFLPIALERGIEGLDSRSANAAAHWLHIFGRLRDGQPLETAALALRTWQPALREASTPLGMAPASYLPEALDLLSAAHGVSLLRDRFGDAIVLLLMTMCAVLLIACTNTSVIILAKVTDRHNELSIRRSVGASSRDIVRGLLAETSVLCVVATSIGLGMALWAIRFLVPLMMTPLDRGIQPDLAVHLDLRLALAAAMVATVTSLIASILPSLRAVRQRDTALSVLGRAEHGNAGGTRVMVLLMGGQVALSLMLVSTAGLLVKSFVDITSQETAVDASGVLIASAEGPLWTQNPDVTLRRINDLVDRVARIRGIEAASASVLTPLSGIIMLNQVSVPGFAVTDIRDVNASVNRVTPGFLRVVGTRLAMGRQFDERDRSGARAVAIVNTAFQERYFFGANPLGRSIRINGRDAEVVGVVEAGKYMSLREPTMYFVYVPLAQWIGERSQPIHLAVKTDSPGTVRAAMLTEARNVESDLTLVFRTLADDVYMAASRERLLASLATVVVIFAIALAAGGLYGTFSYGVERRRGEIGVRMALGAERATIVRLVMAETAMVLAVGVLAGSCASVAAGHSMRSFIFEAGADQWPIFLVAVVVVVFIVGCATGIPALRASTIDPAAALRN